MRARQWLRWLVLYPVLLLSGCHLLLTGSPIPLWRLEELQDPVAVQSATDEHLVLADGRTVSLPFIRKIAHDHPQFQAAAAQGVEVGADGRVVGLLWLDKYCGLDPYHWCRVRIDLSELSGVLRPSGIDVAGLHPELAPLEIEMLLEQELAAEGAHPTSRRVRPADHLSPNTHFTMRRLRKLFETADPAEPVDEPRPREG